MSAGKAAVNLLEELLKKDIGDITEDMISNVLKGASRNKDLKKNEYSLVHATTRIEEKMQGTISHLKNPSTSQGKHKFQTYNVNLNVQNPPKAEEGNLDLVRKAYRSHFEEDVTEDVYEAFRGTKDGYQAGMKTRLDKHGRHTGEFYTPNGKDDILEEISKDRKTKSSPYQEDRDYISGGRANLSRKQKAKGMMAVPPEMQSEIDLGLKDQVKLYRRSQFGSEAYEEAAPEFTPEKYKKVHGKKKGREERQKAANKKVDKRNQKNQKKHEEKLKARSKKAETFTESIETRGEVFEVKKDNATYYQASKNDKRRYRTKEGAKLALREQERANVQKYGEAYYDERLNAQYRRGLVERAAEVGGYENMRTANQVFDSYEARIQKGGIDSLSAGEQKIYENLKGNGGLEATVERDNRVFFRRDGKVRTATLDELHAEIKQKEMVQGIASKKNKDVYESMEKAGYSRDNVIEFLNNKGYGEEDAYDVLNMTKRGSLEYRPAKPSERISYEEDVFVVNKPEVFYNKGDTTGPQYMKRQLVKERNRKVNQMIDDPGGEGWTTTYTPHTQGGGSTGPGSSTSVNAQPAVGSANKEMPEIVNYTEQAEYKQIYNNMMKTSAPASLVGGLVGGGYTFATQYDSNESFGTNIQRVGVNAAIGAAGGAIGGKLGKTAFDASAKKGSLFSNIMTASENYANANPNSAMYDQLQSFASGRSFMYGDKGGNMASTQMQKLASASRVGMYAGVGLGSAMGVGTFGSSRNNKSSGLNQKRGNKF